jgi:hypothetical protein
MFMAQFATIMIRPPLPRISWDGGAVMISFHLLWYVVVLHTSNSSQYLVMRLIIAAKTITTTYLYWLGGIV